jgi:hypothetical protein
VADPGRRVHGAFVVARWRYEASGDDHAVDLADSDLRMVQALLSPEPRLTDPGAGAEPGDLAPADGTLITSAENAALRQAIALLRWGGWPRPGLALVETSTEDL